MPQATFDWSSLSDLIADSFSMDESRRASFKASKAARLIAALPYAAGAADPDRLALAHLGVFVLSSYGDSRFVFDHRASDDADILSRLAPIADHPEGDPAVVKAGLARLGLMILAGYERDMKADPAKGFYNPLSAGTWDIAATREELRALSSSIKNAALDAVISTEDALRAWWDA
jgi:hypothetical protein